MHSHLRPCLKGQNLLVIPLYMLPYRVQTLQQDIGHTPPFSHILEVPLGPLQSECCLLPSVLMLPRWEAHPSRILSESRMKLLTISVVVALAMCSHSLHTRYVYVCVGRWVEDRSSVQQTRLTQQCLSGGRCSPLPELQPQLATIQLLQCQWPCLPRCGCTF